ncbi:MAG: DUF881 domain-containing protein [Nocardioides sp.]
MPEEAPGPSTASTPARIPGTAGRDRLLRALRRPGKSQITVGLLLALVGLAAVTQVRSNDLNNDYGGYREQGLIEVLESLARVSERSEREIAELERTRDELRSTSTSRKAALKRAQQNADDLRILAGLVPATGPGIRVTINDGGTPLTVDVLLDTIQELRTAGAEAIEFNDEVRVVARTAFEVGASGLLVDDTVVPTPYVIDAIGDPETLAGAITFSQGPQEVVEERGGTVQVDGRSAIDVQSVATAPEPEFARSD